MGDDEGVKMIYKRARKASTRKARRMLKYPVLYVFMNKTHERDL